MIYPPTDSQKVLLHPQRIASWLKDGRSFPVTIELDATPVDLDGFWFLWGQSRSTLDRTQPRAGLGHRHIAGKAVVRAGQQTLYTLFDVVGFCQEDDRERGESGACAF